MNYNSKMTGRIISQLRMERGMSQEVLSGLAGIARSHLAMIETGRKNANVDTLWRIANALGMPLSELIRTVEVTMEQEER
jgi:transcriptional regulator with XRE-family HTH domain